VFKLGNWAVVIGLRTTKEANETMSSAAHTK
jgi:hypothetical protein